MARGRFISNEIARDKKINELSDDTSRLAFTWLITFADAEGRTYGDPALVRSMIFPRRTDVTVEQMERYIQEWHDAGLVVWYEADDDLYIYFPKFEGHQIGLRKDREPDSTIPAPPGLETQEDATGIRQSSDNLPADVRQSSGENRVNVKLIEVNDSSDDDTQQPKQGTSKKKTQSHIKLEYLEQVFADARGCDPPDWTRPRDAPGLQKTWRTPLRQILKRCQDDEERAGGVIRRTVAQMKKDRLTFSMPIQILTTAESMMIDEKSGGNANGYTAA